jgi:hypothetical protein
MLGILLSHQQILVGPQWKIVIMRMILPQVGMLITLQRKMKRVASFGGGLTSEQKDILSIFEKAGGEGVDEVCGLASSTVSFSNYAQVEGLSITRIRRFLVAFERAVDKNHDQRSKYPDDPSRFEF